MKPGSGPSRLTLWIRKLTWWRKQHFYLSLTKTLLAAVADKNPPVDYEPGERIVNIEEAEDVLAHVTDALMPLLRGRIDYEVLQVAIRRYATGR